MLTLDTAGCVNACSAAIEGYVGALWARRCSELVQDSARERDMVRVQGDQREDLYEKQVGQVFDWRSERCKEYLFRGDNAERGVSTNRRLNGVESLPTWQA